LLPPPLLEPALQLSCAGLGLHSSLHQHVVVGAGVSAEVQHTTQATAFRVASPEHHSAHPRLHQSPSTHRAGFEGHQHGAVVEAPVTPQPGGLLQGHQLCMAQGLLILLSPVAAPAHRTALVIEHHSGHRNLTLGTHGGGPAQQALHPQGFHRLFHNLSPCCEHNASA
jgi:hypothetical protein